MPHLHDLPWLNYANALETIAEPWAAQQWRAALSVVMRRDVDDQAHIPVGVRGMRREQRVVGWVQVYNIVCRVAPKVLVERECLLGSSSVSQSLAQATITLALHPWSRHRGVTGNISYTLATETPVPRAASDLDLLIRAPQPPDHKMLRRWQAHVAQPLYCVDTQVEMPYGAFVLNGRLRDGRVLLKTSHDIRLTATP